MKTAIKIFVLLMLTASLTSCEKISNLLDVEIETTIDGQLNILTDEAELKSTDAHGFNSSETIDVWNEDLSAYKELVKDFKTQKVTLRVVGVDSTGVEILVGSTFSISSSVNTGITWPVKENWPIEQGLTVSLEAESYSVLNALLLAPEPVTFSAIGTCNKGNVTITLNYGLEVIVESNPL